MTLRGNMKQLVVRELSQLSTFCSRVHQMLLILEILIILHTKDFYLFIEKDYTCEPKQKKYIILGAKLRHDIK